MNKEDKKNEINNKRALVVKIYAVAIMVMVVVILIINIILGKSFTESIIASNIFMAMIKVILFGIMQLIDLFLFLFGLYVLFDGKI